MERSGSWVQFVLAIGIGIIAALLKITTAAIWMAPAIFLLQRQRGSTILMVAIPIAAGLAWSAYADSIRGASPATAFLTGAAVRDWTFGTIAQRLDPLTWVSLIAWLSGLGLVVVAAPTVIDRTSRMAVWAMSTLVLGPIVFTNLYAVHDYYWMAVAPAAALLTGVVFNAFGTEPEGMRRRLGLAALVYALSFAAYPRWMLMFAPSDPDRVLPTGHRQSSSMRIDAGTWTSTPCLQLRSTMFISLALGRDSRGTVSGTR